MCTVWRANDGAVSSARRALDARLFVPGSEHPTRPARVPAYPGNSLDDAIGKLLIDTVTPLTLEVALAVQTELESRCDEAERLRSHEVERARYQSDLARIAVALDPRRSIPRFAARPSPLSDAGSLQRGRSPCSRAG